MAATASRFCALSQELEHERHPGPPRPLKYDSVAAVRGDIATVVPASDVAQLYRDLRHAPPDSDDFELLSAAFNRRCNEDPLGVMRALEQEVGIA